MKDIAERAGTTTGVVSVTLNGSRSQTLRVSEETRQRVLKAAEELGYRRDPRGAALVTGRSRVIGLMLPTTEWFATPDPFFSLVTTGVAAGAAESGYNLMLYTAVAEEQGRLAAEKIDRRIDGLILVKPPANTPILGECQRQGIATVGVVQDAWDSPVTVNSDDYAGGLLATQHLIDLGHRRIAHIFGRQEDLEREGRFLAYRDALAKSGMILRENHIREGRFNRAGGYLAAERLLAEPKGDRPTAIFAANDLSAHGVLEAAAKAGLAVPEDLSVVGYDDTWYASVTTPQLTSVNMNVEGLGRRAAQLLISRIEGDEQEHHDVLPVSLTVRRSTSSPNL